MKFVLKNQDRVLLKGLEWDDIPEFAVLTGQNGVGKTLLLNQIHRTYHCKYPRYKTIISSDDWGVDYIKLDQSAGYYDAQYYSDASLYERYNTEYNNCLGAPSSMIHGMSNGELSQMAQFVYTHHPEVTPEPTSPPFIQGEKLTFGEFVSIMPRCGHIVGQNNNEINLSTIFLRHYIDCLEADYGNLVITRDAPWVILNNLLSNLKVPVYFSEPFTDLSKTLPENVFEAAEYLNKIRFETKLLNTRNHSPVKFYNLSSGEKVLFSLAIKIFAASEFSGLPELLLLDEPDAHLHPEMSYTLVHALVNVLHKQYGIKIIITTHSATTIAHCPEQSVFGFSSDKMKIASISKDQAIRNLTDGYLTVFSKNKYVFVEDIADKDFYEAMFQITCSLELIDKRIGLNFIPCNQSRSKPGGGGNQAVKQNLETVLNCFSKMNNSENSFDTVKGLIDKDSDLPDFEICKKLNRYNIENYIADPIAIYALLLIGGHISSGEIIYKNPHELSEWMTWGQNDLNEITSYIIDKVGEELGENTVTPYDSETVYYNDINIKVPSWWLDSSGKKILHSARKVWGQTSIRPDLLIKEVCRLKLVPKDLIDVFTDLQNDTN